MDERLYQTLILAGLLHDIGKLLRKEETAQEARPWGRASGRGNHAHDSASFLEVVKAGRLPLDWVLLHDIVKFHHDNKSQPEEHRLLGGLLSRADHYSAYERPEAWGGREATLVSIFSGLEIGFPPDRPRFYRQAPLDLAADAGAIFPLETEKGDTGAYSRDISDLQQRFEALLAQGLSLADLNTALLSLLERYTWATTSAEQVRPRDISLFDHLRTTAAIAACLYLYHTNSGYPLAWPALYNDKVPKLLLIGGDLSGIQGYLYDIANVGVGGGVARRLRARSFWLTALMDVTAHRLLDELAPEARLPLCALLWSNGGRFVLLAPNLESVRQELAELDWKINGWLRGVAQGDLAIHLAAVELRGEDLYVARKEEEEGELAPRSRITAKLGELDEALAARKTRRFGSLLAGESGWCEAAFVQEYSGDDYAQGLCQSCHKLPAQAGCSEGEIRYCDVCWFDRRIGARLVELTHIAYYRDPPAIAGDRLARELKERTLHFFEPEAERQVVVIDRAFHRHGVPPRPYLVEWVGGSEELNTKAPLARRYLANYVPFFHDPNHLEEVCAGCRTDASLCPVRQEYGDPRHLDYPVVQSFECLAAAAEAGAEMLLGVLRVDVDRLGLLFQQGLGERTSISRVATLSRMVDLFFAGWVDHCLRTGFRRCYTVYSGGDDLLVVGPWDETIRLAQEIARCFRSYAGDNPNVTLSAAIAVTKPGFPIAKAARQAGEWLEERAKGEGRARLHLFGTTAAWRRGQPAPGEVVDVAELLDDWGVWLDEQLAKAEKDPRYPFSTSAAYRLLRYAEMCRRWQEDAQIHAEELRWLSQLEYDLARNVKPDELPERKAELEAVKLKLSELGLNKREVMGKLRMPVTWALLKHRRRAE